MQGRPPRAGEVTAARGRDAVRCPNRDQPDIGRRRGLRVSGGGGRGLGRFELRLSHLRGDAARPLGSALLRKPAKLARLVGGLVEGSPLPVSVKIRLSPAGNKDVNALEHIEALAALDHKPAFVTLHARTATQRYGRAATWEDVEACARKAGEAFRCSGMGTC